MWSITSPKKKLTITVQLSEKGTLTYQVLTNGICCAMGTLGINTSLANFTSSLNTLTVAAKTTIDESYSLPAGKKAVYTNHANEMRLSTEKDNVPFVLAVRAYDNGAAFRYEIPAEGKELLVFNEATDFCFPEKFQNLWLQNWVASYEAPYNKTSWGTQLNGRHFGMPALVNSNENGPWLMINEANVLNTNGNYCISHLKGSAQHRLVLDFAPEEKGQAIKSALPFQSPWRYLLVEDTLDGVVNSTLNYNLNPPSVVEDTSWIHPARALWAWWSSDMGAQMFTEAKQYVDFAAAMGFEAVVVDAGWDETWIREFCEYAHKMNISPWLWSAMQSIDTEEKARHYLPLWKSWGIDGVKIDFFENDSAHTAWQYNMMADIMKDEKLMINFHGSTKPMGEGRTWPHFITAEGIMGLEHYKWSDMPNAKHNCTVPFIRNAAGPMDYTPTGFTNKNRNTSMAHQMALAAVFESGCQHYSSSIFSLEPWKGTDFLRRLKPKYDGLKLLGGYPGSHVEMLRWANSTEEYVLACICDEKRDLELSLNFLPEGEFEAELYTDNRFGDTINCEKLSVTQNSVINISMAEHGGAGLYIARKISPLLSLHSENYMCKHLAEISASTARPILGSVLDNISDEHPIPVLVLKSGAEIVCPLEIEPKPHTLRFFYSAEDSFRLQISDGVSDLDAIFPASGSGVVFAVHDVVFPFAGGPSKLVLTLLEGAPPLLDKMRIINNQPEAVITLSSETAILSGGAALIKNPFGKWQIAAMPSGSKAKYLNIMSSKTEKHLLRINYYAGPTGTAKVAVNEEDVIDAKLSGVGMWGATKPGDILSREIVVHLLKGANTICISANQTLPPIRDLQITLFRY